jgi:prevent-host-death family protein
VIDQVCTALYSINTMAHTTRKGAEEARNQMPALLEAAEKGTSTIITKHGRPVAALVPLAQFSASGQQKPLLPLKGTGRGLWGRSSVKTVRALRDEWNR